jgi:nucleoid-associated protein YgaU
MPQNLADPETRLPQEAQRETPGTAAKGGRTGFAAGAAAGMSGTLARQVLQIRSSDRIGFAQARQTRAPAANTTPGGAGEAAGDSSMSDAPQFRQNFCKEPTLLPHAGQNGIRTIT